MNTKSLFSVLGLAALVGGGAIVWAQSSPSTMSVDDYPIDLVAGEILYAENCAACHGANLEGQGDWRTPGADGRLPAPPHDETGHTWHHPDSLLFTYTKLGGVATLAEQGIDFNSGMPGFESLLTDAEIWNTLAFIKSKWPERMQTIQAERSANDAALKGN